MAMCETGSMWFGRYMFRLSRVWCKSAHVGQVWDWADRRRVLVKDDRTAGVDLDDLGAGDGHVGHGGEHLQIFLLLTVYG
jgi:hypothetical protein